MPSTERLQKQKLILQQARILFSAYRKDQFADEEGFMASVAMVLGQYPDDVTIYATSPLTGVQRRCKWPPTMAEIIEACDARMQDIAKRRRYENFGRNNVKMIEPPREERPTYDELKAKYGENFGLKPMEPKKPPSPAPSWQEIQTFYLRNPDRAEALIKALDRTGRLDEPETGGET